MATSGCSPVAFVNICENALYFEESCPDLDEDALIKSTLPPKSYLLRSHDNKFLVFKPENQFQFQCQNLSDLQQTQTEHRFNIWTYNNGEGETDGRGVILCVNTDDEKKKVLCCNKTNQDICCKKIEDLPRLIEDPTKYLALFYLTKVAPSNTYMFKSSCFSNKHLGFKSDVGNPTLIKLVLLEKVDDRSEITLLPKE